MKTKKRTVKPTRNNPRNIPIDPDGNYTASIKILGRTHTSTAPDLRKAIDSLPLGKVAKGMSVLEITHGENKKSVILPPAQTFRVFSSHGIIKEIAMKNLLLKLGGI